MSAYPLTEAVLARIRDHDDDFILVNFANPDMVGHTGVLAAAIKAVETVDECAGKVVEAIVAKGGVAIGISEQFGIPIKYLGVGEGMHHLQVFDKKAFVEALFKG